MDHGSRDATDATDLAAEIQSLRLQLEAARQQVEKLSKDLSEVAADRAAVTSYADDVARRLREVLGSRSWRSLESVRSASRVARRALGRPAAAPQASVPARPRWTGTRDTRRRNLDLTLAVIRAGREGTVGLFPMLRSLERLLASDEAWLARQHAVATVSSRSLAPGFSVVALDAIIDRYREIGALRKVIGTRATESLTRNAVLAFTRVGRYQDALAVADSLAEPTPAVRYDIAEASWTREPERAASELEAVLRHSATTGMMQTRATRLLARVRPATIDRSDEPADAEMHLLRANLALSAGDPDIHRRELANYFTRQGLSAVSFDGSFAFERLTAASKPAEPSGPLVTVVTTAFNAEGTLRYAAESILRQTHSHLELLIVDDCSTDGTATVIAELAAADPRVRPLRPAANGGTYRGRNLALRAARGEYITFHDSDDWAHPQRLSTQLALMRADPAVVATRSQWLRAYPDGEIEFRRWGARLAHPNPASTLYHRQVYERIGDFDTVRFGADSEYWKRAEAVFGKHAVKDVAPVLGMGRLHERSLTQSGTGAWNDDHYSAIRSAYSYSYHEWHATTHRDRLRIEQDAPRRAFWAPAPMRVGDHGEPLVGTVAQAYPEHGRDAVLFVVTRADLRETGEALRRSLDSIAAQSDPGWRAVVATADSRRVSADTRVVTVAVGATTDTAAQIELGAIELRNLGGGYLVPVAEGTMVDAATVTDLRAARRRDVELTAAFVHDPIAGVLAPAGGAWENGVEIRENSAATFHERGDLPRFASGWRASPRISESLPALAVSLDGAAAASLSATTERARWRSLVWALRDNAIDGADGVLAARYGQR